MTHHQCLCDNYPYTSRIINQERCWFMFVFVNTMILHVYRSVRPESPREVPARKIGLLSFGLGWRDRNKVTSLYTSPARFLLSVSPSQDVHSWIMMCCKMRCIYSRACNTNELVDCLTFLVMSFIYFSLVCKLGLVWTKDLWTDFDFGREK